MACSLCRQIPRTSRYPCPSLPAFMHHLGPFDESGPRRCPECQARYWVAYQQTYDDMDYSQEVEVTRDVTDLARVELLQLDEAYLRQDAAFALARAGNPEPALTHADPLVRRSAVCALETPCDLRALLEDEDPPTRLMAARRTTQWLLTEHRSKDLLAILRQAPPEVRQIALANLRNAQGLDCALLAPALENASEAWELTGLEWLASQNYQTERQLSRLMAALHRPHVEMRLTAVRALENLRDVWGEQGSEILQCLGRLLKSDGESRYAVLSCLSRLGPEHDLRPMLPVLGGILGQENAPHFQQAGRVLSQRLHLGEIDPQLMLTLLPGLTFTNDYQRRLIGDCYRALLAANLSLGPAQEVLLNSLSSPKTGLCEDLLVPAITHYLLVREAWPELERLLRGGSAVAGHVALQLSQQSIPFSPLEPVLNQLLDHPEEWVAENCLKSLIALEARKSL